MENGAEGAFPRGKGNVTGADAVKRSRKRKKGDENLFDEKQRVASPVVRKKKKGQKNTLEELADLELDAVDNRIFHRVTFSQFSEGVLLLGSVKRIGKNWIDVSLPFNLVGYLKSDETLIENKLAAPDSLADLPDDEEVGVRPLAGVLREGQVIPVAVASLGKSEKGRKKVILTMKAEALNRGLVWPQLSKSFAVFGIVQSKESHGYILNLGRHVPFTAFLPFAQCDNEDRLFPGTPLQCVVHEDIPSGKRKRSVRVSALVADVSPALTKIYENMSLQNLRAGALVNASVTKIQTGALAVTFLSVFTGSVDLTHYPRNADEDNLKVGKKVKARILFVNPALKHVSLSLREELVQKLSCPEVSGEYETGVIFDDANIVRVVPDHGVFLRRDEDAHTNLFAHISRLADDRVENIAKHYKLGQTHKCRVLGVASLDGLVNVSLAKSVLDQVALRYEDLQPGQKVDATVEALRADGCAVKFGGIFEGLIRPEHLSDVRLLKRAKERYSKGASVLCRVLEVRPKQRKVFLTAKKSLLKNEEIMPTTYDEARSHVGSTCVGFVQGRTPALGVLIGFCGGVRGYVAPHELGMKVGKTMSDLEEKFPTGRTLKARVLACEPKKQKLFLSLKKQPTASSTSALASKLLEGDMVAGTLVDSSEDILIVQIEDKENGGSVECSLPMEHLADTLALCKRLMAVYKPAVKGVPGKHLKMLDDLMVLKAGAQGVAPLLTRKPSLIGARKLDLLPKSLEALEELKENRINGYVQSTQANFAVVGFCGGVTGVVRKSRISDSFVPEIQKWLRVGQSVVACVEMIDVSAGKVSLSLRKSDLAEKSPLDLLPRRSSLYFNEYVHVQEAEASKGDVPKLDKRVKIGQTVQAVVESRTPNIIVLQAFLNEEEKVSGFVVEAQTDGKIVAVGDKVTAVVLDVDSGRSVLDLSLKANLLETGSAKRKKLTAEKIVDCTVELVKEDVVILSLPKHNHTIAHALSRDVNEPENRSSFLRPGMKMKAMTTGSYKKACQLVEIDRKAVQDVVAVGSSRLSESSGNAELKFGELVTGKVTSVHPMQVNVGFGKAGVGRLHASEALLDDESEDDTSKAGPLSKWKVGSSISARVVSIRSEAVNVVELSLRNPSPSEDMESFWESLERGKKAVGFVKSAKGNVLWLNLTPTLAGRVNALDSARNIEQLNRGSAFEELQVGEKVSAFVLSSDKEKGRIDLSLIPVSSEQAKGEVVVELDKVLDGDGIRVKLPGHRTFGHRYGNISLADIADDFDLVRSEMEALKSGAFLTACLLHGARDGDGGNDRIRLSLRPSRLGLPNKVTDPEILQVNSLSVGDKIRGFVKTTTAKGCFVTIGSDLVAKILLSNLSDGFVKNIETNFPPGKLVSGRISSVDKDSGRIEMSLRADFTDGMIGGVPVGEIKPGVILPGVVKSITDFGVFIQLSDSVTGLCHKSQLSDGYMRDIRQKFAPGQRVRTKVLEINLSKKKIRLCLKPSELAEDPGEEVTAAMDALEEESDSSDDDGHVDSDEVEDEGDDSGDEDSDSAMEVDESAALSVPDEFEFSDEENAEMTGASDVTVEGDDGESRADEEGASGTDEEDDESADEAEITNKKSSKEKRARKRLKEKKEDDLRAKEEALQASIDAPVTAEDFERLLMGMPNSSMLWIKFIALRLSLSQVAGAREVAERALQTIDYRDELQKLNIWVAYVNLEANYGDQESFNAVYDRACKNVDLKQLHLRLVTALKGNSTYLEVVFMNAFKKLKASKQIWISAGKHRFENGQPEEARKLLEKALTSLDKRKHIPIISKFAQMEYRYGSQERGRTVFEGLVGNMPKRVDLWGIYLDMEVRVLRHEEGDTSKPLQACRKLFERTSVLDLSTKKMKYFLKRYLEFEKEFGTEETAEYVKEKARAYVEAKMQ